MPRGNDAQAALHELADRFGQGVGNAELLIDANLAANTEALRKAQMLPRDDEATQEARKKLRDGHYKGPDGERVVSVAVRGAPDSFERYTVVVYRTEEGRDISAALDDKDKVIESNWSPPAEQAKAEPAGATGSGNKS